MNALFPTDDVAGSDPVRVLYVTPDDATGSRLESLYGPDNPALGVSYVTSVDAALAVLDAAPVDHVVVDSAMVDGTPASGRADRAADSSGDDSRRADRSTDDPATALRREVDDATVHVVRRPVPESISGDESPVRGETTSHETTSRTGRVRALANRVESAVAAGIVADGGETSEQFRTLAETLTDALLVVDADSVVRFANPAVEDVFGYDPGELVGDSLTTLMPPALAQRHREGIGRYLDTGQRTLDWDGVELTGRRKDGTEVPVEISFSEFRTDGEVRFAGVVRDITDQNHQERELRDRVRQQRAVAEFSRWALEDRPLEDLFDRAVELVADALDHEYAKVLELRPEEDDLLLQSGVGWRDGIVGSATVGTERDSQAGYTLLSERPVVVEDLETEERFSGPDLLTSHDVKSGVSTVIGTPDDPWGILGVHDTESRTYADHDVQFVESVAHLLATAIRRREHERELERHDAMLDAVDDGVYALDADSRFVAVNDAYLELTGYSREELLGEHVSTVVGEDLSEESQWVQEVLESGEDVATVEATLSTKDGEGISVEARVTPLHLEDVDGTGRVGVVRDVSDRKRREERLTALTETAGSLADAETPTDISEVAVDAAVEVLDFPSAAVVLYDDDTSALEPAVSRWDGDAIDDALLGTGSEGVAWQTFVESESRVVDDLRATTDAEAVGDEAADTGAADAEAVDATQERPGDLSSVLAVPLGKHGVFLAAAPERAAFDATDRSLADLLCSNVRSALDRAEREQALRERRDELRRKNRELERVNRINAVVRELTKAVTRASSPGEVMQAACDRLTDPGPYRFAWFGSHDRATGEVEPRTWAGVEEGYLHEVEVTADDRDAYGRGPAGRALRTKEVQVQNDLLGDPPFEPWREQALKRGYRSSASVPVVYGGTVRGVLNLYAGDPDVFDATEREVLSELGEFVGYALNALEQRQALASDRSVELDFRIRGTTSPMMAVVSDLGGTLTFESAVQRDDGRLHVFVTITGADPEEALAEVGDVSWVEDVRVVTDRDDESLYEATLSDDAFLRSLLDRGAFPRTITMTDGEGRFVVRIPQDADVRTFVTLFEDYYDDVELVARRERDEPVMTRQEFEAELGDRLTDRQWEVVRMAYFSGFFEWPRESTAQEIADTLGVSQPTVSRHVRGAERELFGLLFEDG